MLLGVLIPVAILGILVLGAVLFFQRGAAGVDLSARSFLRAYLYLGSLVSILVLAWGLSLAGTGVLGLVAPDFAYGQVPRPVAPLTPSDVSRPPSAPTPEQQHERQARENLLQGITASIAGALFFGVHWYGRRQIEPADERQSPLRRGYWMIGVAIFGVASIVLVPAAAYESLRYVLIPIGENEYRAGVGENLAGAVVMFVAWLLYLRVVLTDYRRAA